MGRRVALYQAMLQDQPRKVVHLARQAQLACVLASGAQVEPGKHLGGGYLLRDSIHEARSGGWIEFDDAAFAGPLGSTSYGADVFGLRGQVDF